MHPNRRIRRDARRLADDPEAAAFFECLVKHAFDPALDRTFISKQCDAPKSVRRRLAKKIGPLGKYVTALRMTKAKRLVLETELTISEISKRTGYTQRRTFRRNFRDAHGLSPYDLRKQTATDTAGATVSDATDTPETIEPPEPAPNTDADGPARRARAAQLCRQRVLGMLDPRQANELRLELRRRYPQLDAEKAKPTDDDPPAGDDSVTTLPIVLTPTGDRLEDLAADSAFSTIFDLPPAEQRFALLRGLQLGNITAFHHLSRFALARVYADAERSLRFARLGVELVDNHRAQMNGQGDQWKALAWVGLGRVQVFSGHFGDADQSLAFAAAEVGGDGRLEPWVEIELRAVEGLIRRTQRRDAEAARAFDRALELGRELHPRDPQRSESVLQRLELASATGDAQSGFDLADELEELVTNASEPVPYATLWRGLIAHHRAKAYSAMGLDDAAERLLRQALAMLEADRSDSQHGALATFILHELARLASRDDRISEAASLLRLTLERYRLFELSVVVAAAEGELAVLCALLGQWTEARQLAKTAADFLDDLPALHREAWSTARRLRTLGNGNAAASEDQLREHLTELQRDLDRVTWEIPDARLQAARSVPAAEHAS